MLRGLLSETGSRAWGEGSDVSSQCLAYWRSRTKGHTGAMFTK